ncbi:hypothetical protein ALI22I_38700 [Saccharothrix sp. ALI-22-I]|jgi:hypothetical protein|uniref:hypothetical protein n=1 Tax=Saccharothrix TaxID=2071 RepID=UPI00097C828B|nr:MULTISPECIES: hypothetical protein [Saccharothrix]ONI82090.1 hypothetical protein ALI22I_38700 [Saccharothrix sp. ALI-22-I]
MDLALSKVIELRESGFQFLHLRDEDGQLDRIMAFKQRRGFIDSILFWSETEARAGRLPAVRDSQRAAQAVWIYEGPLVEAVDRLLDLPEPGTRNAPSLMKRTASDLAVVTTLPFKLKIPPGAIA